MCTKRSQNNTNVFQINHFLMVPSGVWCIQCVSDRLARWPSSFQLHVCPAWTWQVLGGVPGRKYVLWPSQVLSSLSIAQKLPDEWESNHSSLWHICWNWNTKEETVTYRLSKLQVYFLGKKACVSTAGSQLMYLSCAFLLALFCSVAQHLNMIRQMSERMCGLCSPLLHDCTFAVSVRFYMWIQEENTLLCIHILLAKPNITLEL